MNSLSRMTKAGITLNANGKEYTFSPLELRHIQELEEWLENEPFRKLKPKIKALKDSGVSQIAIDRLVEKAEDESRDIAINPGKKQAVMSTISAAIKMLQMSLSVKHGQIDAGEINEVIDEHGLDVLKDIVEKLTEVTEQESKNLGTGMKKTPRKSH